MKFVTLNVVNSKLKVEGIYKSVKLVLNFMFAFKTVIEKLY